MTGADDDELVRLLEELVRIDSVNPGLDPGGPGELVIAGHVQQWATGHGLNVERAGDPARPSLIISTTRTGPGPTLLLCGHLDTVGHGTMTNPTTPRLADGRLHGRGAYDMKGGLAAALTAATRLNHPDHPGTVIVAAVADEEHLSLGAAAVLESVSADAAIVTEPTELSVAVTHRGFAWIEISVAGVAAHGSRPELGVDAIVAAGPVLTGLAGLQRRLAAVRHPDLGPGTVHASLISGGQDASTIPGRCTLLVERRTIPGEPASQALAEIEQILGPARLAMPAAAFSARVVAERSPLETPGTNPSSGPPSPPGSRSWASPRPPVASATGPTRP